MIAGHGTPDQAPGRLFAYRHPEAMARLLAKLADHSADYLIRQVSAGADAVQIFDSWSGVLDEASFEAFCVAPVARMVKKVKAVSSDSADHRVPEGRGHRSTTASGRQTGVDALGLDWTRSAVAGKTPAGRRRRPGQSRSACASSPAGLRWTTASTRSSSALADGPLVFNLGHGITPETPIAHVERMIERVRGSQLSVAPQSDNMRADVTRHSPTDRSIRA